MVPVGASSSFKMDGEWSRVKKALCILGGKGTMEDGSKQ